MLDTPELRRGAWYAIAAYAFWGLAPFYFKAVAHVGPTDILGHRIVWSVLLLAFILSVQGAWRGVGRLFATPRLLGWLALSAVLIAVNWGTFIYAVVSDHLLQASFGYYVNPLVSTVLGMLVLGERLRTLQWAAVALAAAGTATLAWGLGGVPLVSLVLALTFAGYGLVRKLAGVEAVSGLFVETLLLAPLALGWLVWLAHQGAGAFGSVSLGTDLLLVAGGLVTTLPLLWFVGAARRLPLSAVGFFQYLAPTLQLLLAVLVFGEPFDGARALGFGLIWSAVGLYIYDMLRAPRDARAGPQEGPRT